MNDTSGFYKLDTDLLFGPNEVVGPNLQLLREHHLEYSYPSAGWYWFDSEEQARTFFNLLEKTSN